MTASSALPRVFLAPVGATLPAELETRLILDATEAPLDQRLAVARAEPDRVVLVVKNRELAAISEFRDLFGFELSGLLGLPGGRYDDSVFASYMATMPTVHMDAILEVLPKSEASQQPENLQDDLRQPVDPFEVPEND